MFDITRNWFEIFIRPDNMKYSQSVMRTIHSNNYSIRYSIRYSPTITLSEEKEND